MASTSVSPSPERSNWRCVPSPQSTSQRAPPRATSVAEVPRAALGTDADVPMNVTCRSTARLYLVVRIAPFSNRVVPSAVFTFECTICFGDVFTYPISGGR